MTTRPNVLKTYQKYSTSPCSARIIQVMYTLALQVSAVIIHLAVGLINYADARMDSSHSMAHACRHVRMVAYIHQPVFARTVRHVAILIMHAMQQVQMIVINYSGVGAVRALAIVISIKANVVHAHQIPIIFQD